MPAQPKPPGQRRRRNAGQAQWKQLPAEGPRGSAPKLPSKKPAWLKSTREWWVTIWASPMATVWEPADVDALVRLARMRDEDARNGVGSSVLAQMTALEDRFGLSPKARRALQWEIQSGDNVSPIIEPRKRRLRAVG